METYPADFNELNKLLETIFEEGPGSTPVEKRDKKVLAAIVPSSPYKYSGKCSAWAYKEIGESNNPETFIILGGIKDAVNSSVCCSLEDFDTTLGFVKNDKDAVNRLKFAVNEDIHKQNDFVRAQLPLLQFVNKREFVKVAPVLVSSLDYEFISKIAANIINLKRDIILIASSDLMFFGEKLGYVPFKYNIEKEINRLNEEMINLIVNLETEEFLRFMNKANINLPGVGAIAVVMEVVKKLNGKARLLDKYPSYEIDEDKENFINFGSIVFDK